MTNKMDYDFDYNETKRRKINYKIILPALFLIVMFSGIIGGGFYVMNGKPNVLGMNKDKDETTDEIAKLVKEVGGIMLLPAETPLVATVNDQTQTNGQKFFSNAQKGDKVLVFQGEKKAILYRPSEKRIIEVGYVKDESVQQDDGQASSPTPEPTPQYNFNYSDNVEFIDELIPSPSPSISPTPTASP